MLPLQPVDATHALNLSTGVSNSKVYYVGLVVVDGFEIQPNKQADKSEYFDIQEGVEEITHGLKPFLI